MRKRNVAERDERCRRSGCPNYIGPSTGAAVNSNDACAFCTGPVVWTDVAGVKRGNARACTSCPMNGRCLPVCWAACPGPNEALGTDGQRIVTTGGMADESGFIARYINEEYKRSRHENCSDAWVDAIDDEDVETKPRDRRLFILQRLLDIDGRMFGRIVQEVVAGEAKGAADLIAVPAGAAKELAAVMAMFEGVKPAQWEIVRRIAKGETQAKVAQMLNIRKQAVNQSLKRMARKSPWVGVLLEWVKPMSNSDMRCDVDNNREGARASVATFSHKTGGLVKINLTKNAKTDGNTEKRGVTNRK